MRDVGRMEPFSAKLIDCWSEYPDWRFGQFICNFFGWLVSEKGIDPFFPEEDKMAELLDEYKQLNAS